MQIRFSIMFFSVNSNRHMHKWLWPTGGAFSVCTHSLNIIVSLNGAYTCMIWYKLKKEWSRCRKTHNKITPQTQNHKSILILRPIHAVGFAHECKLNATYIWMVGDGMACDVIHGGGVGDLGCGIARPSLWVRPVNNF